jgi:threonine/homoserine/homoserine lactone efflux protein
VPELAGFLAVSIVVIVTPGQDTILTIRNALAGGRRGGIFTAVGVALGQLTWSLAASVGVAALLVAYEPAFVAIKLGGALYLVYLGARTLRSAFDVNRPRTFDLAQNPVARPRDVTFFRQGLLSNLGNPKMAVFFSSLLPQFVAPDTGFAGLASLGLVFCSLTLAWLAGYSVIVARASLALRREPVRRALEGVTGTALIVFGAGLAFESR